MELKLADREELCKITKFYLYLYGIEIADPYSPALTDFDVLIVPLWNWNLQALMCSSQVMSSNCTFMELKFARYIPSLDVT